MRAQESQAINCIKNKAEFVLDSIYKELNGEKRKRINYNLIAKENKISRQAVTYIIHKLVQNGLITINTAGISLQPEVITYYESDL